MIACTLRELHESSKSIAFSSTTASFACMLHFIHDILTECPKFTYANLDDIRMYFFPSFYSTISLALLKSPLNALNAFILANSINNVVMR